jgi:hypothetical protein
MTPWGPPPVKNSVRAHLIQKILQSKGGLNVARLPPHAKHNVNVVVQPLWATPPTKNSINVARLYDYLGSHFAKNSVNVAQLDGCVAPAPSQKQCKCGSAAWLCGARLLPTTM